VRDDRYAAAALRRQAADREDDILGGELDVTERAVREATVHQSKPDRSSTGAAAQCHVSRLLVPLP
jgi:hypothetical protein